MKRLLLTTTFLISCSHFDYDDLDSEKKEEEIHEEEVSPLSSVSLEDLGLSDEELEEAYQKWMSRKKKKQEAPKKEISAESKFHRDSLGTEFLKDRWHTDDKSPDELRDRARNFRGPLEQTEEIKELERSRESFRRALEKGSL